MKSLRWWTYDNYVWAVETYKNKTPLTYSEWVKRELEEQC